MGDDNAVALALGELTARLAGVEREIATAAADARQARDGVLTMTAVQQEQRVSERLEALRGQLEKGSSELRSDMVNAISRVRTEIGVEHSALSHRVSALEDVRKEAGGVSKFIGFLAKVWPGAVAFLALAIAWGRKFPS